jgi:phage FluMu gp28-like protein
MGKRKTRKTTTTVSPDQAITVPVLPDLPAADSKSAAPKTGPPDDGPRNWFDLVPVLGYQWRWIMDGSQLKVAVWSRQSGKSFAAALRAVMRCVKSRTQYIILSKGERQSRMFMEKVRDFCEVFKQYHFLKGFDTLETDEKTMEVHFPDNGSRIIGLPANPDTARGYSGNIVLDEFAFHGDARKIYAACFPIITRGYSIEVISTPNGTAGKFYEIAKAAGLVGVRDQGLGIREGRSLTPNPQPLTPSAWSGHRVDIYDAVDQGLPANIDLLRSGCDDEETWLQEYCCQFLSDAQNYIPVELISTCVHEEATAEPSDKWQVTSDKQADSSLVTGHSSLYLGVDIGRKRDLTIAWLFEKVGDVLWSRQLVTLKGVSFDEQERAICALIEGGTATPGCAGHRQECLCHRVCIDQSGIGMMLAEHLVQRYGAIVEPVTFTTQLKERLAPMVKQAFEERTVRIPDNREVRADINSVKRFVTLAGNVRFDAEHTDRGHADRFWALAMVVNAATEPRASFAEQATITGLPVTAGFMELVI